MTTIHIVERATRESVKIIDVTGKAARIVTKIDNSININLNHSDFYTILIENNTESTNDKTKKVAAG